MSLVAVPNLPAFRARLRAARIDEQLARGADPDSEPLIRERASKPISARMREQVATGFRGALDQADHPRPPGLQATVSREAVRDAGPAGDADRASTRRRAGQPPGGRPSASASPRRRGAALRPAGRHGDAAVTSARTALDFGATCGPGRV